MKTVSIIVPVYNAEKYLDRCLNSLVHQTLQDIEIILVNDGSTDGSAAILQKYAEQHPGLIRLFHKENGGQGSARNLALEYADGEYIGCVDADDAVALDMFEKMYQMAKEKNCDAVACDTYTVRDGRKDYAAFRDYNAKADMFKNAWVSPCNKIIKRSVYAQSKVRFPEGCIYEDTAWFGELIPYLNVMKTVREPLYYRYVNKNSTMTAAQGMRTAQIFPVMNHVVAYYKQSGLYDAYYAELEYFYIRILLLSSLLKRIAKIHDRALRSEYTNQTLQEVYEKFPDFRRNKYLKGAKGLYIKHINRLSAHLAVTIMHLKYKSQRG